MYIVPGIFEGRRPVLYIIDPDLIKSVLIGDSDHFIDRNSLRSREPRFLSRSLINLKVCVFEFEIEQNLRRSIKNKNHWQC